MDLAVNLDREDYKMAAAPASCMSTEHGCVMFDCLVHLWEWIDPPVTQTEYQMENKKNVTATQQPLTQQHIMAHHVHPDQIYTPQQSQLPAHINNQSAQIQPNGVMHQLLQSQYQSNMNARSPLLENRHEIYGTGHNHDYARHYGANDNYNYPQSPPRLERTEIHTDHNVNHELLHNMPKGYNAEVYQDYLKRNPPKDSNQIYQNHQPNVNQYRLNVNQYGTKPYLPYSNRIGPQSNTELLRKQYNEIQQMKMQQQMHYQNQAQMHQQQKFAERQLLLQQIHGVQPPPNLQNSIYSDSSYRDLDRYSSKNDFKEYSSTDLSKDLDRYAKNNEYKDLQNRQYHETHWQSNQSDFRDLDRQRQEQEKVISSSPPSDFNNQRNTDMISPMKSSESSTPSIKSPSSDSRRSSSGTQALRSPSAQRIPSAPVTLSGMLYKQGSDGLKVWRKRWFVLSEYCLFYYKSQDEEKLLGSVLLPSYKVSACTAEDKVMRKFAFKLEHANMRTYVLAALDQEAMMKWVKALTLAALMQTSNEQQQKQNDRAAAKTEDGDEAGPTYANAPPKPRRANDGYNSPSPDMYDPNYDLLKKPASHYSQATSHTRYQDTTYSTKQEIYTSSPQSPPMQMSYQTKRPYDLQQLSLPLTKTAFDNPDKTPNTPSTNKSNPQSPYFENRSRNQQQITQEDKIENLYEKKSSYNPFLQDYEGRVEQDVKNDERNRAGIESNKTSIYNESYPESRTNSKTYVDANLYGREVYGDVNMKASKTSTMNERLAERRTPDAYGRSTAMSAYNTEKIGDYEDIYAAYGNETGKIYAKSPNPSQSRDTISLSSHKSPQDQPINSVPEKTFSGPSVLRRKKMQASGIQPPMPRPHSADFLEYESKNEAFYKVTPACNTLEPTKQPPRPKSSLDINSYYDPSSDKYYSEESYAQKMRQSAQYLQQQGLRPRNIQIPLEKYASGLAEKQLHSPYTQPHNNNYETEFSNNRIIRDNVSYNSKYSDIEGLHSNWTLKEKDLENQKDYLNRSGSVMSDGSHISAYVKDAGKFDPGIEGFMRSASARLPSSVEREGEKKVQQREESMKRLLEWKQRMLQSPLTRKSTPAAISLTRSLNQSRQSLRSDQYKPKMYKNASYNSYSSDDEEETPGTDLQNTGDMQAGRSHKVNNASPSFTRLISPHALSSPSLAEHTPTKDTEISKSTENVYENIFCAISIPNLENDIIDNSTYDKNISSSDFATQSSKVVENQDGLSNEIEEDGYETQDSEAESETQIEYTDNDLDEVLLASDNEIENQRGSNEGKVNTENIRIDELETDMQLEVLSARTSGEDHYLPMSPRKMSAIEPAHKTILENLSVFDHTMPVTYEDNPYVEMNLGIEEDDMQTYEIVCVNNGKAEPVYMELNHVMSEETTPEDEKMHCIDTASNFADTKEQTLKRISKTDKNIKEKAEFSDAEDENSKDVSLDTPFSRFSISDNFRPASYYLSGSRTILDRQDSSDSDILPPPPIPTSSPPFENILDEELSKYILDKLDKSDLPQDNSIIKMLTSENQNLNKMKRKTTSLMIYGSRTSIHDTLTRGEKVRSSRASLTQERNKVNDTPNNVLNTSIIESHLIHCNETDSLRSFNADKGSSRLSVESDTSSRFEMAPSNISSEITSLVGSDSMVELRHPYEAYSFENVMKRRPLSDDSIFELTESENLVSNTNSYNSNFDEHLQSLERSRAEVNIKNNNTNNSILPAATSSPFINKNNSLEHIQNRHTRSSSSFDNQNVIMHSDEDRNNTENPFKYNNHAFDYLGSQSSCSSTGLPKSPLSFYSKSFNRDTLKKKNLNSDIMADKIKEFESEKQTFRHSIETPVSSNTTGFHSRESSAEHSAPYYYSDLSSQEHINVLPLSHYLKNTNIHRKLNNQRRRGPMHRKNEISHIHNPIRDNDVLLSSQSFDLATSARSVSVEFLSVVEKTPDIDLKNIYESTSNKTSKIPESMNLIPSLGCKKSPKNKNCDQSTFLEGNNLSHNGIHGSPSLKVSSGSMSSHCSGNSSNTVYYDAETETSAYENVLYQGEKHWDEDILWRDNLRRVSHRHARSMDDLDTMPVERTITNRSFGNASAMNSIKRVKKNVHERSIKSVTYVNCDIQGQIQRNQDCNTLKKIKQGPNEEKDENDVYVSLVQESEIVNEQCDEGAYEQLTLNSSENSLAIQNLACNSQINQGKNKRKFEIDRENLRQWDLMSSGLMKSEVRRVRSVVAGLGTSAPLCNMEADSASNEASMTMSGTNIEPGPNNNNNINNNQISQQTLSKKAFLGSNTSIGRSNRDGTIPVRAVSPRVRWVEEKPTNEQYCSQPITASQQNLNTMMATEDVWTTVRSPSRALQQPIKAVSPRVRRNTENDDMRKVGHNPESSEVPTAGELLGRSHEELVLLLIQLRRRHAATHRSIEQCCVQISSIEDCLSSLKAMEREENLQRLEQLKTQLMELENHYEKSKPLVQLVDNMVKLGSLYNRPGSTIERLERNQRLRQKVLAEHAMEQQRWLASAAAGKPLETEAARVRVAELWALEQELADEAAILQGLKTDKDAIDSLLTGVRSKLDSVNIGSRAQPSGLEAELARVHAMLAHNSKKLEQTVADNARLERELHHLRRALRAQRANIHAQASHNTQPSHPTAMLENEVTRVQQLVSALQRQRQELSRAVRHLTQQSHALQITHDSLPGKRRPMSSWQETNLDTGHTIDHGQSEYDYDLQGSVMAPGHYGQSVETPLYVDTRAPGMDVASPINSEEMQHTAFGNLSNVEKQEIKTVRIVKRESERRQRDRDRSLQPLSDWSSNHITANLDQFLEEELVQPINNYRASSLPRTEYSKYEEYYSKPQNTDSTNYLGMNDKNMQQSPKYPSSPSLSNYDYSRDISSLSSSYNKTYDRSGGYDRNISLSTQYLNSPTDSSRTLTNDPMSKTSSIVSLTRSNMELSPIFKSEAAKQIITEMSGEPKNGSLHRRQVPKEKRRHYTAPHHLSAKTLNEMPKDVYNQDALGRSLDDADMERALRGAAPDVVRSALPARRLPDSIDQLLAAPQKIIIPERYIPEKPPELSPEEQQKRQEKVESIKKMLTSSSADPSKSPDGQEKRQREHLLQMNQILAKQVTEMSKIIAVKALEELPLQDNMDDYEDRSPDVELPIYQQRDNFFT